MGDLSGRHAALTQRLIDSVLAAPGHTPSELRRAVLARAARLGGRRVPASTPGAGDGVPAGLARYLDKVALHAHRVSDGDVAALQRVGHADDVLFELTVAAALGAALGRLERGLAALRGEEPD
jgi:alkylhydroperoxidase family enzyme